MYVDSSSIPPEVVQREKELIRSRIQKAEMLEKAFKGHMAKFSSENCLLDIEWIIPPVNGLETEGKTVGKVIELECREIGLGPRSVSISRFVVVK
jgi:translation elongation factor EF-Ts